MARRRLRRVTGAFPPRLERFDPGEWSGSTAEAVKAWQAARVAFFREHGPDVLGVDFVDVLQGNVAALRAVRE